MPIQVGGCCGNFQRAAGKAWCPGLGAEQGTGAAQQSPTGEEERVGDLTLTGESRGSCWLGGAGRGPVYLSAGASGPAPDSRLSVFVQGTSLGPH